MKRLAQDGAEFTVYIKKADKKVERDEETAAQGQR